MSKKNSVTFLLFILLLLGSFIGLLQMQRGALLKVTMSSQEELAPQIYFKGQKNQAYSEQNSIKGSRLDDGSYQFQLNNYRSIGYLRLDPSRGKSSVEIKAITLIEHGWFHTHYFTLDPQKLTPLNQIANFKKQKDGVAFETTGNDPYLEMPFVPKQSITVKNLHVTTMMLALLIALTGAFLLHLYYNYEHTPLLYAKLILYALFFAFTIFKVDYYKEHINFGYPPDELAHLSYIEYVHNNHHFLPDYSKMKMINDRSSYNYLSHPPLYYEIMNLNFDEHMGTKANAGNFRALSSLLFLLSYMLILFIAFRAKLSIVADFVFLTVVTAIPMHAYVGASISNDTLAMLGGALFAIGFVKLLEKEYSLWSYFLVALGILIAYFAKLTAALLIFFAGVLYLLSLFKSRERLKIDRWVVILFVTILIPILYYQLSIIYNYHAIVPTFNKTHPQEYLESRFYIAPEFRQHLNLSEWFARLLGYIEGGWFGIHSHHSFTKESWFGSLGLLVLHIFAMIALVLKCPKSSSSFCRLGKITLLALFMVLTVQFFFSYRAHLHSGYMGGLQPRYLLPFMFAFAIMASLFVERFQKSFWVVVGVILLSIHALYSDFFYFLQYYR